MIGLSVVIRIGLWVNVFVNLVLFILKLVMVLFVNRMLILVRILIEESRLCVINGNIIFNLKFLDCFVIVIVVLLLIICVFIIVVVFGIIGLILLGIIEELGCNVFSFILFKFVSGLEFI